jgi:hypothetical protein
MSNNSKKIDLDQLLDLKRAERPSAEFWDGFQKDFRQRQLQTLIQKESPFKRLVPIVFSKSSVLFPLSGLAVALFVLIVNFQEEAPMHSEYFDVALTIETGSGSILEEPQSVERSFDSIAELPLEESARAATASFVMDLIPNEEPDSLSYTREFPTATIPAERRSTVASLVSFSIAHDSPNFGMGARPQTVGF